MPRTRSGPLLAVVATTLLCGCVAPYAPPQNGPTALVQYTAGLAAGTVQVLSFDSANCDGKTFIGAVNAGEPGKASREATVAANKELVNTLQSMRFGATSRTVCSLTIGFVPTANAQYRVDFDISGGQCGARVTRGDGSAEPTARPLALCKH